MNRIEFMNQLARLLSDIPEAERREALEYYNSYFDDAGEENEAAVIRELGSPGKVAAIIKADLNENNEKYGEYTERGYTDTRMRGERQSLQNPGQENTRSRTGYHPASRQNTAKVVLLILAAVILLPVLWNISKGLLSVVVAIVLFPISLTVGVIAATAGILIAAVSMIAVGIAACFVSTAGGLFCIGIGFLLLAVGILMLLLSIWICLKALPWMIRKITEIVQRLFHRAPKGGNAV